MRSILDGVEAIAAAHPATFRIPSRGMSVRLVSGDLVEHHFRNVESGWVERLWVETSAVAPAGYSAKLNNDSIGEMGIVAGEELAFLPENDGRFRDGRRCPARGATILTVSPEPVEFSAPRRTSWLGLLGSLGFVALGLFLMITPGLPRGARLTGLANVLFFGLCAAVYARDARGSRVALLLDSSGLEHRHPDPRQAFRLAWTALRGVRVETHERGATVVLALRDPQGLPGHAAPDWVLARGAWPPTLPPETSLSPAALGTTPDALQGEIERFRRYYGDPHETWGGAG